MTERLPSITTQIATQAQPNPIFAIYSNDALPVIESADEEPYTIKCICEYSDDDGNTIYCETCDTWQHIECFYPGRVDDASRDEFDHSCADCKPRPLDRRHATERQRLQRQNKSVSDYGEKKTKRPLSKSHKKKVKPSDVQVNGIHDHDSHRNGSPHEHNIHVKKSKGHKSTQSVSAPTKRSPPLIGRAQNLVHPPSPAHTPPDLPNDFEVHGYSDDFLKLYDSDNFQANYTNSFASLSVSNSMTSWIREPERLKQDAGTSTDDAFHFLKVPVEGLKWPSLHVETKQTTVHDMLVTWRFLVTPSQLQGPGRIGELNGLVGFQKDYCSDVDNRWQDLAHPRPFVFFHPRLPLFVDTRREGSLCRYVRRSCRANANLEIFIAGGTEYHFWLTIDRVIAAMGQVTIPWDFRFPPQNRSRFLHFLNLSDDDSDAVDNADITDEEYAQLTQTIQLVLSDHGGCACDLGNDCAFVRFHRNYKYLVHAQSNAARSKKGRKAKPNHVSPTSTGHATNSRAPSEGQPDHYDDDDNRSVSGSVRSKPHSRDLTPLNGVSEGNGILSEPSEREKRKLAMLEDSFRKLDQGQPPRKKKRPSDSSSIGAVNHQSVAAAKPRQKSVGPRMPISQASTTNGSKPRPYVDASNSRRQSASPLSAISPTAIHTSSRNFDTRNGAVKEHSRQIFPSLRPTYTDSTTQTEESKDGWWICQKPKRRRLIVPLAQRLLNNRYRIQSHQDIQSDRMQYLPIGLVDESSQISPIDSMDIDIDISMHGDQRSPKSPHNRKASISSWSPAIDAPPTSADLTTEAPPTTAANAIKPPPPPWPGQTVDTAVESSTVHKSELRVQLPPTSTFPNPNMSGPLSGSITPSSTTGSVEQSPYGSANLSHPSVPQLTNGVNQILSPIKATKKLSLSDYKARAKMKKTDSSRPSTGNSPVPNHAQLDPLATLGEARAHDVLDGSTIVDSPTAEQKNQASIVLNMELSPRESGILETAGYTL